MSREQRQQAGFTLLEFLIAATLMALMGAAVFGSLTVALNSYARSQERMDEEGRQRVLEDMVRHQLEACIPGSLAQTLRREHEPDAGTKARVDSGRSSRSPESSAGQGSPFLWEFVGFDLRYCGAV